MLGLYTWCYLIRWVSSGQLEERMNIAQIRSDFISKTFRCTEHFKWAEADCPSQGGHQQKQNLHSGNVYKKMSKCQKESCKCMFTKIK